MYVELGSVSNRVNTLWMTSTGQLSRVVGNDTFGRGITNEPIARTELTTYPLRNPINAPFITHKIINKHTFDNIITLFNYRCGGVWIEYADKI